MEKFGAYAKKDFEKIAEIIIQENLDVVALQEIFSEGKGVKRLIEQCVMYGLRDWDVCLSTTPNRITNMREIDSRGEIYAFLWNKKRFKLAEFSENGEKRVFEPRIINSLQTDVNVNCSFFARTPYYIRLFPAFGGFWELRLINVHIYYGDNRLSEVQKRIVEYDTLVQDIYPSITQHRYGNFRPAYTIAMGDYNLNIFRPQTLTQAKNYLTEVYNFYDGRESYRVITLQDQLTTLKAATQPGYDTPGYANNYDHFTYSPELSPLSGVSCNAIDAIEKYCDGDFNYYRTNISDHLPIVMEVEI